MKFESSQRSHIKESRRLKTSAFLLSGNDFPFLLRSPSSTQKPSKPYPFADNGSSVAFLPTGMGAMSLTDAKVKNAKLLNKEYKLTDGFGMFLHVTPKRF